ncbi:MAG TPA: transcriptional repressor [Candidatus Saccharimonadia bacterium]|jgi:Fur family ferric uptake transcriptional regulator|nr:transcriptional repressor [Candidatus Saccharimonadia bacterium]
MNETNHKLATFLRDHGYSVTRPRKLVFQELRNAESVTMGQLWKKLSDSLDRASIYRTISLFEELGIAKRVNLGWKYKVELSGAFAEHHHHMTCTVCGKITAINEDSLEDFIEQLSSRNGFVPSSHQIEILGLCQNCAGYASSSFAKMSV